MEVNGATKYTIRWDRVSKIIEEVVIALKDYGAIMDDFVNWYLQKKGSMEPIDSDPMVNWIIRGIPKMRNVINALEVEQSKVTRQINAIYTQAARIGGYEATVNAEKYTESLRKKEKNLLVIMELLLGCSGSLGEWYLSMLEHLRVVRPDKKVFINVFPFFQDTCLRTRTDLLKY